jgi:4'-phosphopantetheinyl transferase
MGLIEINTRNIDEPVWLNADDCLFKVTDNVDVWRVSISDNISLLEQCLSVMTGSEIERGNRFFQVKDKNRHIVTRGCLRMILCKYLDLQPNQIAFETSANGKPFIAGSNSQNLHFNVSHSGNWIMIGIANTELGVDVEQVKPKFEYHDILALNFSADEITYITQHQSIERFFLLWTRKEAFLKATGQGLNNNLVDFSCLDGLKTADSHLVATTKNWFINSFKLQEGYPASITVSPEIKKFNFFNFTF